MERDPVCGMTVDPEKAAAKAEHAGKTYYFCAPGCARRFQQAPDRYLLAAKTPTAPSGLVNLHSTSRSLAAAAAPAKDAKPPKHESPVGSAVDDGTGQSL